MNKKLALKENVEILKKSTQNTLAENYFTKIFLKNTSCSTNTKFIS